MWIRGLFSVLAVAFFVSAAEAQESAARAAFEQGITAARAGNWESARGHFEEAYELAPRPSVLVNLAGAQRQTGQLVEAKASYERWLEDPPNARLARRVRGELSALTPLIPTLEVSALGEQPGDEFLIDGNVVDVSEPVEVNPGWREIEIQRGGRTLSSMRVNIDEGDHEQVQLTIRDVPGPRETAERGTDDGDDDPREFVEIGRTPDDPEETEEGGSKTWLWVTLAVVGVAIAGGVTAAVLVSGGEDPFIGNAPPGTAVLR